ncbi:tryptophan halogenase family protein [Pseudoalteromonas sp. SWYJZ19]|uniref:tryptophan halogenase family protein n=1 Tax=Pseudoalteromonas sp. SWYJZ19 TaxID=2792068 RepID=UPI0018CEB2A7|nr:tryptophan halogenase family protein [Pseudoalteromonas sp. SWYJZ19]MBH0051448.1 tryptophan 7-halogenase [Pseudoalteromonas sp. SWYJZ19]
MTKSIAKIVVLGGGTAGWLSAGLLAAEHPHLSITLIESANVPILGVGEGTWPSMRNTLQRIGIKEIDFITQCDASFKQGSKFINWRNLSEGENYYHPFMNPQGYEQTNLHASWQRIAPNQKFADVVNMQSFVCQAALAPKQLQTPEYAAVTNYGYHLDAGKFAEFLKNHCVKNLNVTHITDDVTEVINDDHGYIASLKTNNNGDIIGDLFIDCSGSRARLIGEHFNSEFIAQDHILFNNSAVAAQIPNANTEQPIASATLSTAQSNGWVWDIALPTRRGTGYVFSSKYQSDESATNTLKSYIAKSTSEQQAEQLIYRVLKFNPGYRQKFWIKNCVAVGMSAGFLEPLEASALAMVELSISMISEQLPQNRTHMSQLETRFNDRFSTRWQRVIEFLKLHYVLSERDDTPYWQDISNLNTAPERLQNLLKLWQFQPPSRFDFIENEEVFSSSSYQYVLYGMGFNTQTVSAQNTFNDPRAGDYYYQQNREKIAQCLNGLPSNRALLNHLLSNNGQPHND